MPGRRQKAPHIPPVAVRRPLGARTAYYLAVVLSILATLSILDSFWEIPHPWHTSVWIRRFADAMLLALPAWFLRRRGWLVLWLLIIDLYLFSNLWYYRNYGSIMPLSSYAMWQNLDGLGPSIRNSMRREDGWLLLPAACLVLFSLLTGRFACTASRGRRLAACGTALLVAAIILLAPYRHDPKSFDHPGPRFRNEPMVALRDFGWTSYWIYQIANSRGCTEEERIEARRFVENAELNRGQAPGIAPHGKNLILILMESQASWPIGLEIDGRKVQPFLDSLARDTSVLYFPKVLPQVKDGRSSDAQLLINTGLLPAATGAASSLYGSRNTYPSLPKALKKRGYTSASFVCDFESYWNQEATTRSFGFDTLHYDLRGDHPTLTADEELYRRSLAILKRMSEPFYAQVVTMSGHDAIESGFDTPLNKARIADEQVKNYLVIAEYVDRCLATFIDSLKRCGLYERSLIVITGDHDSITRNRCEGRRECRLEDRYVPLFLLNAPRRMPTDRVIAQCDIYPTLLDAMGIDEYLFHGLGESLYRHQSDCAADHTSGWVGEHSDDSVRPYRKELWRISDILLRADYFREE